MQYATFRDRQSRILIISIILLPILNSSHIGTTAIGYGDIFLVITFFIIALPRLLRQKIVVNNTKYVKFLVYATIITLMNYILIDDYVFSSAIITLVKYIFYSIVIFMGTQFCDMDYGEEFYLNICVIETIYEILQLFLSVRLGVNLPYVLPQLPMEYGLMGARHNAQLLAQFKLMGFRGVGFFPEPSHFAEYTIFAICILLYKKEKSRKDFIRLALVSMGILLTKSSVGIVCYIAVSIFYFCGNRNNRSYRKLFNWIISGGLLVAVFIIIGKKTGIWDSMYYKYLTIFNTQWGLTGNLRVMRGFTVYARTPLFIKMFGIGCSNYNTLINEFNIVTFYDVTMDRFNEYMNAIGTILIHFGIVGLILYINAIIDLYKKSHNTEKSILVAWGIIMCTENFFFAPIYVMALCLVKKALYDDANTNVS